jgi:hypothetical protein
MRRITHPRAGEIAMASGIAAAIVYEHTADDLLSVAVERWRSRHPVLVRFWVVALAAHWTGWAPPWADIFDKHNVLHRSIYRLLQPNKGW